MQRCFGKPCLIGLESFFNISDCGVQLAHCVFRGVVRFCLYQPRHDLARFGVNIDPLCNGIDIPCDNYVN